MEPGRKGPQDRVYCLAVEPAGADNLNSPTNLALSALLAESLAKVIGNTFNTLGV
jgi:hypothetical protein